MHEIYYNVWYGDESAGHLTNNSLRKKKAIHPFINVFFLVQNVSISEMCTMMISKI